jgi:CBS domain-containing protein
MGERNVGAVAIMQGDNLTGILTERDVLRKVVAQKKNPENVLVREVMTSPCQTIQVNQTVEDALALMVAKTIHHLALVDENGKLAGLVS